MITIVYKPKKSLDIPRRQRISSNQGNTIVNSDKDISMARDKNQRDADGSIDDDDVDLEETNDNDIIYEINTYGADFTVDGRECPDRC